MTREALRRKVIGAADWTAGINRAPFSQLLGRAVPTLVRKSS